jgi:hypothetical protein
VDEWVKTSDEDAWPATRQAMRFEGLLVGGSSGAVLAGALRWLKSEEGFKKYGGVEGVNVVILFPDGYVPPCHRRCKLTHVFHATHVFPVDHAGYEITCRNHGSKASSMGLALHPWQHRSLKPLGNPYHRAQGRFAQMGTHRLQPRSRQKATDEDGDGRSVGRTIRSSRHSTLCGSSYLRWH